MIQLPETKLIETKLLQVDGKNPNKMQRKQLDALKKNIERYGFLIPIITNKEYLIADGEHRYKAAKELKLLKVPVISLPVKEVDRRILRQVMNKLRGEHDSKLDNEEYKYLFDNEAFDDFKELMAFTDKEEVRFLANIGETEEDDYDVEKGLQQKTNIRIGDVYELGEHRLMCGDATKKEDIEKLMGKEKATMVHTDPPYGLGGYAGRSGKFEPIKGDDDTNVIKFYECMPKEIKEIYLWGNQQILRSLKCTPRDVIIWKKNNIGMGRGYRGQYEMCFYYGEFNGSDSDVWEYDKELEGLHPTMKPIELCGRAIKNSSNQGEIVLDLFGGSGSTLIASEQLNRKCYMMEIDPQYVQVIIERWEKQTNKKAKQI